MKFVIQTQTGEPVEVGAPNRVAHRYIGPDGSAVVVVRDARGRLLPGAKLTRLRAGDGRPPRSAYAVTRRALGVETKFMAHTRRKREASQ